MTLPIRDQLEVGERPQPTSDGHTPSLVNFRFQVHKILQGVCNEQREREWLWVENRDWDCQHQLTCHSLVLWLLQGSSAIGAGDGDNAVFGAIAALAVFPSDYLPDLIT